MSVFQMLNFNPINFILNMIAEISEDGAFNRKMRRMEKYLNIDINDTIKDLWKDKKYVDHDWYLNKGSNDCIFAILNRNYIKKISPPQKKVHRGEYTTWYIRLTYQDGTKDKLYARRDPQGLTDICNWFQGSDDSFCQSKTKSRLY